MFIQGDHLAHEMVLLCPLCYNKIYLIILTKSLQHLRIKGDILGGRHLKGNTPGDISKIYPYPPTNQICHYNPKYAFCKKIYNNLQPPSHNTHTHTPTPTPISTSYHPRSHSYPHSHAHTRVHIYKCFPEVPSPSPSIRSYLKSNKIITLLQLIVRDKG